MKMNGLITFAKNAYCKKTIIITIEIRNASNNMKGIKPI